MTIFNLEKVNYKTQPIFFGEPLNVARFDEQTVPAFETINKKMMGYFWKPEEVDLQRDRMDYKGFSEAEQHIFTKNLSYQILLDSVQQRGTISALIPIVSIPELEAAVITWSFFEMIHSRSYSHLIRNVYPNPSEVLDNVMDVEEIIQRASSVGEHYNHFIENLSNDWGTESLYRNLYRALVSIYILESIRFYVSFACTFAFAENKKMEGSAKIIQLIARDENLHASITQHLLNMIHESPEKVVPEPEIMKQVVQKEQEFVLTMFEDAANEEKRWADFLFQKGTIIGLNAPILHSYVEWMVNRRMANIGLKKLFGISTNENANPLPWTKNWLSSRAVQVAPQEVQNSQYIVGAINKNVDMSSLENFEL